eukprot:2639454-Prymnesium_polylepis.1
MSVRMHQLSVVDLTRTYTHQSTQGIPSNSSDSLSLPVSRIDCRVPVIACYVPARPLKARRPACFESDTEPRL